MHTKVCKALFSSSTVLIRTTMMVYAFIHALYHSCFTRQSDPLGRRIWWCHIPSPSTPNFNLYFKSNGKLSETHKHDLWEPTWSILHLLLNLYIWHHAPPFSFDPRHTVIVLPAKNTMLYFFHMQLFLKVSPLPSLPSCLLLGLVNSYSLFTAQFNGQFP